MKAEFVIAGARYRADFTQGRCIAIALEFNGTQPSHFGAPAASVAAMRVGDFIGDTRRGGSCNVPVISLNPHCNGTHTESVGHIVDAQVSVHESLRETLMAAALVSVNPVAAPGCTEHYLPPLAQDDRLITRAALEAKLADYPDEALSAIVIRTLPNDGKKLSWRYGDPEFPPFLTLDAIDYLNARGVRHLLVDFPSVDKMYDEGKLSVHHRFWNVPEATHTLTPETRVLQTITEMIYVPDAVEDGIYLLELQIPAFQLDAAPSRPLLYALEKC